MTQTKSQSCIFNLIYPKNILRHVQQSPTLYSLTMPKYFQCNQLITHGGPRSAMNPSPAISLIVPFPTLPLTSTLISLLITVRRQRRPAGIAARPARHRLVRGVRHGHETEDAEANVGELPQLRSCDGTVVQHGLEEEVSTRQSWGDAHLKGRKRKRRTG